MKKALLLTITILGMSLSLFADGDTFFQTNILIQHGLDANLNAIQANSVNLTLNERAMAFEQNKKDPLVPFALNFFLGWGIGSFYQGDTGSGAISLLLTVGGAGYWVYTYFEILKSSPTLYYETSINYDKFVDKLMIGSAISLVTLIFNVVTPFVYASGYNDKLGRALNMNLGMDITPSFSLCMVGGNLVPTIGAKIRI